VRRILAALTALCLLVMPAAGRVLVMIPNDQNVDNNDGSGELRHTQALRAAVLAMLNATGVDYDIYGSKAPAGGRLGMITDFCRRGVVTYNCCGADSFQRSYEAVIHVWNHAVNQHGNGYRPDSLFSSIKRPLVPQLFIVNSYSAWANACVCSLVVTGSSAGYNANTNYIGWSQRYRENSDLRYRSGFTDGLKLTSTVHIGDVYRMIVSGASNTGHAQTNRPTVPLPCIDCDSLLNPVQDDSGVVVIQYNAYPCTGCPVPNVYKPLIIASGSHNADDQIDVGTIFMGLAALDSTCGGTIIKKPLQFSINIRGGFRRNTQSVRGGIAPEDSVALKASIDSIATLGVPFTVGVNLDSVGTYASEKFWWQRAPTAHFAPESWSGVNDSAHVSSGTGGGGANYGSSIDIWGRFRSRVAVGSMDNTDSSLANMIRISLARTDSIFTGKLDRAGLAASFDWAPRNIGAVGQDSLWYAIWKGGLTNVVFETQNAKSMPLRALSQGYMNQQTRMKSSIGGEPIRILGTPMAPDSGSAAFDSGHTTDAFANSPVNSWCKNTESLWSGLVGLRMISVSVGNGHSSDTGPGSLNYKDNGVTDNTSSFSRASVFTIHAGDLGSGTRADAATRPTHPGWWAIKSLVNQAKIANLIANRKVVIIRYTEELTP